MVGTNWQVLCHRLCGPPDKLEPPDPRRLAEAVVRVTTDEKLVGRLAQILEKGDRAAYQRFVKQHELTPFCHFFCHWVCLVRYRLICRWICRPDVFEIERPNLAAELLTAGHALRLLLERGFDDAVAASESGDPDKLRGVLADANLIQFCHFICEWFCSWRCILVCFTLCREFPLQRIDDPVREAFEFAQAVQTLRRKPADLERLVAALEKNDAKAFGETIRRLELGRFCIQLCHWLCFLRCRLFCRISCPPIDTIPLFTHVGLYHVDPFYGDFQADGTTTAGRFAFTSIDPADRDPAGRDRRRRGRVPLPRGQAPGAFPGRRGRFHGEADEDRAAPVLVLELGYLGVDPRLGRLLGQQPFRAAGEHPTAVRPRVERSGQRDHQAGRLDRGAA